MLVVEHEESLRLIHQTEHARLCGQFATEWGNDEFDRPEPFDDVLLASKHHDDGWAQIDAELPLNDRGLPMHFLEVALDQHREIYGRSFDLAVERSTYAGLLVGMHWIGLYHGRWGLQEALALDARPDLREAIDVARHQQEQTWAELKRSLWADRKSVV